MIKINDSGVIRFVKQIHVNDQGTLRELSKVDINDAGLKRTVFDTSLPLYWANDPDDEGIVPTTASSTLGDEFTSEAIIVTNQPAEFVFDLTGTAIVFTELIGANTAIFSFASGDPTITSDSFILYISGNAVTVTMGNEEDEENDEEDSQRLKLHFYLEMM